jgi:N-acetylglutamate synthase-like GNAT family acetyltransferase
LAAPELIVRRSTHIGRDEKAVTILMTEYLQWALATMAQENVVFPGSFDSESVRKSLEHYRPPEGRLILAEMRGGAIGVGALRSLGSHIVEIRRMYVRPEARGLHVGSRILDALIEEARTMDARLVRLDSAWFMTEAQNLYQSRGFQEREPYEGTEIPPSLRPRWRFFEKVMSEE